MSRFASVKVGGARVLKKAVVGVLLALGLYSARAQAEGPGAPIEDAPERGRYFLSVRPLVVGQGAGNLGLGARLGAAGEYWVTDALGLGIEAGVRAQGALFGDRSSVGFVAPTIGVRSAPRDGYFIATLGAGYAAVEHAPGSGLCILNPCAPVQATRYGGYSISAAAGWFGHPDLGGLALEIGPVVRLDTASALSGESPTDYLVTLNLEIGFAVGPRAPAVGPAEVHAPNAILAR